MSLTLKDRALGCLLGCAMGDAIGSPIDSIQSNMAINKQMTANVSIGVLSNDVYRISEHTQLMALTADGALYTEVRNSYLGINSSPIGNIWSKYRQWAKNQGANEITGNCLGSWLFSRGSFVTNDRPDELLIQNLVRTTKTASSDDMEEDLFCSPILSIIPPLIIWCYRIGLTIEESAEKAMELETKLNGSPINAMLTAFVASALYSILEGKSLDESINGSLSGLYSRFPEFETDSNGSTNCQANEGDSEEGLGIDTVKHIARSCLTYRNKIINGCLNAAGSSGPRGCMASTVGAILGSFNGIEALNEDVELTRLEGINELTVLSGDLANPFPFRTHSISETLWRRKYSDMQNPYSAPGYTAILEANKITTERQREKEMRRLWWEELLQSKSAPVKIEPMGSALCDESNNPDLLHIIDVHGRAPIIGEIWFADVEDCGEHPVEILEPSYGGYYCRMFTSQKYYRYNGSYHVRKKGKNGMRYVGIDRVFVPYRGIYSLVKSINDIE